MVDGAKEPLAENATSRSVNDDSERRLALEVRSRRLAFAVLQGSDLLDWGVRSYSTGAVGATGAIEKLHFLLNLYGPSVVVVRGTRGVKDESSQSVARVLRKIGTKLKRQSVRLIVVDRRDVQQFFAQYGCHAKHDIALLLASRFPQLKWRLPRARRPWDPEAYSVAIFDAVGTAVAFNGAPLVSEEARL
ncbi:MAG TPA: hypothetical protein VGQ49_13445 [Bryobacteraceae bacterium]|jgi:hypothetical protein|nr:hypothetical protein [Bryobacteraceae bacterium]